MFMLVFGVYGVTLSAFANIYRDRETVRHRQTDRLHNVLLLAHLGNPQKILVFTVCMHGGRGYSKTKHCVIRIYSSLEEKIRNGLPISVGGGVEGV